MADVVTGEAVVLDVQTARLASRVLAFAIDLAIQLLLLLLLSFLLAGASVVADPALLAGISLVVYVGVIVGYPVLCESLWRGRSAGKAALGLRVVSEDGGPERFRQALFRALAAFVEIWLFMGSIAVIASLFSERGRRLGDVFAGTLVIRERVPVRGGPLPSMPPALATWALTLELAGLPDDVALTARQYVARYAELAPEVRDEMGHRIAGKVALHVSPPPPPHTHPLAYLSAVLAERRRREAQRLNAHRQPSGPPPAPPPSTPPPSGDFAPPS